MDTIAAFQAVKDLLPGPHTEALRAQESVKNDLDHGYLLEKI
jgi:hypothetical protein